MLNDGSVSLQPRRQHSVALTTSEAEYMAASEVGKGIKYLRALLQDAVATTQEQPTNANAFGLK